MTISSFYLAATKMNISASQYLGARLRVVFKTKLIDPAYRALTLLILRICDTIEKPCGVVLELGQEIICRGTNHRYFPT